MFLTQTPSSNSTPQSSEVQASTERLPLHAISSIGKKAVPFILVALIFLFLLYLPTLTTLIRHWQDDPNYSHGWLILPLSLWLAWGTLQAGNVRSEPQPWLGAAEILAGCLLHLFTQVVPWLVVDFLGLFLILRGLAHAWGGSRTANALAFPAGFLFFMFPLPVLWTGAAAVWLQDIVSRVSAPLINLFWVCHRRGNELVVAGLEDRLTVAAECSGLRQIVAFFALATLIGYLGRKTFLHGCLLCLLAVPIAVVANVLRVLLMVVGARCFGTGWLEGWMHDLPAMLTLPIGLVLLFLVSRWMGIARETPAVKSGAPASALETATRNPLWNVLGCATISLLAQAGLWLHLEQASAPAYRLLENELGSLPLAMQTSSGLWQGTESARRELLAPKIPFADAFLSRDYLAPGSEIGVNLYAVYSQEGKDREHHPEICVRDVGGATEEVQHRALVPLEGSGQRQSQRFRFRTGPQQVLTIYYWHYTFPLADDSATLSYLQRLHRELRQRPPSITVQVACYGPPTALNVVEKEFLPAVDRDLRQLLPATARIGHERLPIRFLGGR